MSALMQAAYDALQGIPAAVSRGWPQVPLPLPAVSLSLLDDRLLEGGERVEQLELLLRAASPEGADALASQVEQALAPLQLRRTAMKDGAEKDKGSFTRLLRCERRTPALPLQALSVLGQRFEAELLSRQQERRLLSQGGTVGGPPRLVPGPLKHRQQRLRLPLAAAEPLQQALREGIAVALGEQPALVAALCLKAGHVEIELWDTQ